MPRVRRYFQAGYVWHITHRCHQQQFLLKFVQDRRAWIRWLFEARKRYGLQVLDYIVTSNHIHLLVRDDGRDEIAASMQLIAGRTAQQYNRRKSRRGAFWEDRYHATAIQAESHLARCLVYIDLNMVRAGVVRHPADWAHCGYHEIQHPPERYQIIDIDRLCELLGFGDLNSMRRAHHGWIQTAVQQSTPTYEPEWAEAIALGQPEFLETIQQEIKISNPGRTLVKGRTGDWLREPQVAYSAEFSPQTEGLSLNISKKST